MGTPLYTLYTVLYHIRLVYRHHAQGKRTHQASEDLQGAGGHAGREGGRHVEQTRGRQARLGHDQGEEAAGPREQAVLQPRQEDAAHLRQREGQGLRHGQAPEGSPWLEAFRRFVARVARSAYISILPNQTTQTTRELNNNIVRKYTRLLYCIVF